MMNNELTCASSKSYKQIDCIRELDQVSVTSHIENDLLSVLKSIQ